MNLCVTSVRIHPNRKEDAHLKAFCEILINDALAIQNMKIVMGKQGRLFVAFPSRQLRDGSFCDIIFPIKSELRKHIEDVVLKAYRDVLTAIERGEYDEDYV